MPAAAPPSIFGSAPLVHDLEKAGALLKAQASQPWHAPPGLLLMIGLAALAVLLAWPFRLFLLRRIGSVLQRAADRELAGLALAVATAIGTALAFGFAAKLLLLSAASGVALLPAAVALGETLVGGMVAVGLGLGIGQALRGRQGVEPPFTLPEGLARTLPLYGCLGGIALALAGFVQHASTLLHVSAVGWSAGQIVILFLELPLLAAFLVTIGKSRASDRDTAPAAAARPHPAPLSAVAAIGWAVLLLAIAALLTGHLAFSVLLTQELIWAICVVALAALLARFANALIAWLLDDRGRAGHFVRHVIGLRRDRARQACILAGALASVLVWMIAISLILAPLGGRGASLIDQVRPSLLFDGLRQLHLAPRTILLALLVLAAGVIVTRILRRWLDRRFLPATALDRGVRSSIVTGVGYAGILVALLAATNTLGINLDKITLVASALSVGIGFGLQSIIQNFVSGVILLIERPIEVGDWVATSGAEGSVRRIRVRATELETADGGIAIVPNSAFISSPVQNRAAAGVAGRLELTVKIGGAASAGAAREALLAIVRARRDIVADPAPRLFLTEASEGSYTFKLHAWGQTTHELDALRSGLIEALAEGLSGGEIKPSIS